MAVTRSKHSLSDIRGLVRDLPKILIGIRVTHVKVTSQVEKLRNTFWSHFANAFYKKAYLNYVKKAAGGVDDYGVKWKKLSPATLKRRAKMRLAKTVAGRSKVSTAKDLILVRTGRLRDSFKPGRLSGSSYTPSTSDQVFELKRGRIKLGSKVPYADHQDEKRPLLGAEDMLIEDALDEAQKALIKELGILVR